MTTENLSSQQGCCQQPNTVRAYAQRFGQLIGMRFSQKDFIVLAFLEAACHVYLDWLVARQRMLPLHSRTTVLGLYPFLFSLATQRKPIRKYRLLAGLQDFPAKAGKIFRRGLYERTAVKTPCWTKLTQKQPRPYKEQFFLGIPLYDMRTIQEMWICGL